ncbi:unnamed protein product [Porites evermanni]|uniref:Uncharacterized protein n=1 Tax=Porites evermanni TaxID=104178 RepID=A0ABN8SYR1_9CNID|nr:unnamed protein product [Porites evermanni]
MERKKPVLFLLVLLLSSALCKGVIDKAEVEAFQKKTSQSSTHGQLLNGRENLNREHFFSPTTESETMSDSDGDYSIQEFHPSRLRWNQHAVQLEYKPDGGRRRRRKRQIIAAEDTVKLEEDDSSATLLSGKNLIIIASCGVFFLVVLAAGLVYCFRYDSYM